MDTYNMEMSILDDQYKISMLMNESDHFYSLIQNNTIINESFGSKVKEIINKFVSKIKEIWDNIKRWFKQFKVNILINISEKCIELLNKLGWSVTREPGEGTTYANDDFDEFDDDFDDDLFVDDEDFSESVLYEDDKSVKKAMMDNRKYYYYASKDIFDFVNEEMKKSKEIFKSYDEIYDLMNEYTNLSKESLDYIKLYEKYEYDWNKIQASSQFAKIEKLNEELLKTQKEIEDALSTESKDINTQKFDKSGQLYDSRENNKNQRSSQIRLSTVSGDKSFYNDPAWDITTTTKRITPIYKDYFNTMVKKLDLIERYVDNWIKQILTSIKTLERQALSYKDDTDINAPIKMINQNIALYNKYLRQYQDLQKCIKGANKLLISQIIFINTNVVKAIRHNIMFRKANQKLFDYKERQRMEGIERGPRGTGPILPGRYKH